MSHHATAPQEWNDPSERVLLTGDIGIARNRLVSQSGRFQLTNHRLSIWPSSSVESLFWDGVNTEILLDRIETLDFTVTPRRLRIEGAGFCHILSGAITSEIYALIDILMRDGEDKLVGHWPGSMRDSGMPTKGVLAVSAKRLLFVPSGMMDAMVGQDTPIDIPLSAVTRAGVVGSFNKRLAINCAWENLEFSVPEPEKRLQSIVPVLKQTDAACDPIVATQFSSIAASDAQELVKLWRREFDEDPGLVRLSGPALHMRPQSRVRRGWVVLTETHIAFLPSALPGDGERPMIVPIVELASVPNEAIGFGADLHIISESSHIRMMPRGGEAFVREFWRLVRQDITNLRNSERLSQVTGEQRREFARVELDVDKPVILWCSAKNSNKAPRRIMARSVDLSEGGIGVLSDEPVALETGLIVDFDFEFFAGSLAGVVVHRRQQDGKWRLGIEFSDLDAKHARRIRETLKAIRTVQRNANSLNSANEEASK